ncbi:ABC transporter substrate-binding protein [Roseovarius rhodophyticola]|uniref:ABC transporter substrate-binding protein n=1 Tax=Roseovarius rhodophyticola TaxID=3080827 RepID=A0ABZ2TEJ1_9RHOB|nr:ABC transporter substrate-binding protein [Roseovarius sp. W115]MDV2928349.1 ABC transporter substrate-binding protein [Roseovarius sp. W115]
MTKSTHWLVIVGSLTIIGLLPIPATSGEVLRMAHDVGSGGLSNLDPIDKGRVLQITEKTMNRLIRPNAEGRPSPDLAKSWSTNEDGTVWTLNLRNDVRFHDGTTFDADDVVYSLNRILDPQRDSPARSVIEMVKSVHAKDKTTVKLTLHATFADLPLQLMDARLRMIPEGSDDTIAKTGIGTGPFKISKFDADGITVLEANEDYWEGAPKLNRIELIGIPDSNTRLQAFLAGQLDMERGVKPLMRRALLRSDRYVVQDIPTGNWSGLVFRTDVAPFDDVRVRRALRLVVDREEMLKLALDGGGIISCDTPVAPNDQYRGEQNCPQDIEQAKALLAEAGYPDGLTIKLHVAPIDGIWSSMAVVFQQQAAKAGIKVKIVNAAADGYWSEVWMKKDMFATSWGERPAHQALSEAFSSEAKWNESYLSDHNFDFALERAQAELDFYDRKQAYIEVQDYLAQISGTLIPFHRSQLVALSPRVKNVPAVKSDRIMWHEVDVVDEGS